MPRRKRLRSVCHSTAHHAVSGVSFVHPHVLQACGEAGVRSMEIDLLQSEPCPAQYLPNELLRLSLRSLKERFESILSSEGFRSEDLSAASLTFSRAAGHLDQYCTVCRIVLTPMDGEPVECTVNHFGYKFKKRR
jgi:hypothetical protein